MNLDPLRNAATGISDLVAPFFKSMSDTAGIWPGQSADGATALVIPALAGIVAAIAVALGLAIYFRTGYRSFKDMVRHGLAAGIGLGLLAIVAYDIRHAAATYLDKATAPPAGEFELRWQKTTERAKAIAAEMDRQTRDLPAARPGLPTSRQG
jgi:hypothetical protein